MKPNRRLTEEDIEVDSFISELGIRQYLVQRIRRSISANLDFKINPRHTLFARGIYNWRDDRENRFENIYSDIEPVFNEGTEQISGFEGIAARELKAGIDSPRGQSKRLEDQRVQYGALEGRHLFGDLGTNWVVSFSKASEEKLHERYIGFETPDPISLKHDVSDPRFPFVTATNSSDISHDRFELAEITDEIGYTEEEDFNAKLDFNLNTVLGDQSGKLKWGGKFNQKNKYRDNTFSEFSPFSGIENMAEVDIVDMTKDNFLPGDKYKAGTFPSADFIGGLDLFNTSLFEEEDKPDEYLPTNYDSQEKVIAGYVSWEQNLSSKWSFLAGARIENTDLEYVGNVVEDSVELIETRTGTSNYTNFLPDIHLKYNPAERSVVRLAWTNSLARPNYYDLVPYRDVIHEDEEVFQGNSQLEPTTSMNFDLMAEQYISTIGILSAGTFYKKIDGFIYILEGEDAATGYDLFQARNGGTANLWGIELTAQSQLDFISPRLKGFGVYLNYTHIESDAEGIHNEDGELREGVSLPGASPNMFNASLSYENKKLVVRASLNYSDAYIDELGDGAFYDRYYDEQLFLDLNASFAITSKWRIFLEANNLTNQPLRYYQGTQDRTMQMEYYNARLNLGVKYDFFE